MVLSRRAQEFAAEIKQHDWSDAPYRADRAGHQRETDSNIGGAPQLLQGQTDTVRMNVMWVVAQVLGYQEGEAFNLYEFAEACGVNTRTRSGNLDGSIRAGLRFHTPGQYAIPGTWWSFDTNGIVCGEVLPGLIGEQGPQLCRRDRDHEGPHSNKVV
ncbi:hypothetical protein ACFORO_25955 [Amycolatopsis halotolerans]|uniref:Uncharacterized protein n=1 Tax=Amycolatopsis halotolerans TaxID=330083 RepID=A0ABV7QP01_9PSEU